MIPKIIHYCWFGRGEKPKFEQKCISSWKKHLPDYMIKEWNEDNFDIEKHPFAKEAYDNKKYAFVADVVRVYALYHEGGIYLDTDVEVLKSFNPFLSHLAFTGFEGDKYITTGIMGCSKGSKWMKDCLEYYKDKHFVKSDGTFDMTTNVRIMTTYMVGYGLKQNNKFQEISGIVTIYPKDYFCPKSYQTGDFYKTKNTVAIHHFHGSWLPWYEQLGLRFNWLYKKHPKLFTYFVFLPIYKLKKYGIIK